MVCLSYIRGRELAQASRRDVVFGSAMATRTQPGQRCSDASISNSRRFGHVGSIIDPNAVKASVSEWPDFISRSGRVFVGSRAERYERGLFLSHV